MKRTSQNSLDAVARQHIPDDVNLFPRIAAKLERKPMMQTLRSRPALAFLIVLLAITLLTGAAYAVGRSLGYIPGVGIVEQGAPMRVLAGPAVVERDGIVLTITDAVLSSDKTIILYTLENVPWNAVSHQEDVPGCHEMPFLRLPNGDLLFFGKGGGGMGQMRLVYPPIPAEVNEATFMLPCIMGTLPGLAPENWELNLHFKPTPPDMMVVPVIEINPTTQPETINIREEAPFSINNALEIDGQYILTGIIQQPDIELIDVQIMDADGEQVYLQALSLPDLPYYDWGAQFKAGTVHFPLEITFSWVTIASLPNSSAKLEFDAGENPQPGQEWHLDQPIQIGGRTITLETVRADSQGYKFIFTSEPDITGISFQISGYTALGGGRGNGLGRFSASQRYQYLPTGKLSIIFSDLMVATPPKTWTMQWGEPENPPAVETPDPISEPEACLTIEKWVQLTEQDGPLVSEVGGKIITIVSEGGLLPAIYVSGLNGSNLQKVAIGGWPSLSNDGTHLAYSDADGLHIVDLSTGQNSVLRTDGYRIIWSPDDTRLMFTSTPHLYVSNVDGSGLQKINSEPAQAISAVGWLPDNQTVFYSIMNAGGFNLKSHNLQSGEKEALFTIHNKAGYAAVSPDGQWVVFADSISDGMNWGIFISRLDGSDRKLVAEPEVPTGFASVWGPDSQWLIINTLTREQEEVPMLVNPFTCQAARLNFNGMVEGWSR